MCCRFCFPRSDHSFLFVSSHENYSYELPCLIVFFLEFLSVLLFILVDNPRLPSSSFTKGVNIILLPANMIS